MSIVTGEITRDGAVVDLLVGVSSAKKAALTRAGVQPPQPVAVRAQLDTGSFVTGMMPEVFRRLRIQPFSRIKVRTPSTRRDRPCECDLYDVSLSLVSGMTLCTFGNARAIASEDFSPNEDVQAIIGRDVLDRCGLEYWGLHKQFRLSF